MTCHMLKDLTEQCGTVEFALQANPNLTDHLESCESCHAFFKEEQALDNLLEQGQPQLATDLPPLELRHQTPKTFLFQPWMGLAAMLTVTAFLAFWAVPKLGQPDLEPQIEQVDAGSKAFDEVRAPAKKGLEREIAPKIRPSATDGQAGPEEIEETRQQQTTDDEASAFHLEERDQISSPDILEEEAPTKTELKQAPKRKGSQAPETKTPRKPRQKVGKMPEPSREEQTPEPLIQDEPVVRPMEEPKVEGLEIGQESQKDARPPRSLRELKSKSKNQPMPKARPKLLDTNQGVESTLRKQPEMNEAMSDQTDRAMGLSRDSRGQNTTFEINEMIVAHEKEPFLIKVLIPAVASTDKKLQRLVLSLAPEFRIPVTLLSVSDPSDFPFSPGQDIQLELDERLEPGTWTLTLTVDPTHSNSYLLQTFKRTQPARQ